MIKLPWRDPLEPPTANSNTGHAVLVRDSTPLQYLRLLSSLAPQRPPRYYSNTYSAC